jgi:hypothetical protein
MRWARKARLAVGVALVVVLAAGACHGAAEPMGAVQSSLSGTPTATPEPTPTEPPVDPLVTVEVCGLAAAATDTTTTIFNEQMSAFELAAAREDTAAMETAAKAVNQQFVSLGRTVAQLAARPIDPALRVVLTQIASALTQMTALDYTGTTVDQRKKLVDFTLAIDAVCVSATVPASEPAG